MKKIIYCLVALVAVVLASCSNDDIEVAQTGGLTLTVNTQAAYDQFNTTDEVREMLRTNTNTLHVMTFVYDIKGNLVTSKEQDQNTFNTVQFDLGSVPNGEYTVLTIETVMVQNKTTKKQESPAWNFEGMDKLSTVKATQKSYEVYYPYTIGASTDKIVVNNLTKASVTPKAIGSLFQFYFENFDKSSYIDVGFACDDMIDYYLFDPSLERSARFHTDLTSKGYTNVRCSAAIDGKSNVHQTRYILENNISYDFCFTKTAADSKKGTWTYCKSLHGKMALEDGKVYYAGSNYVDANTPMSVYLGNQEGFKAWVQTLNGQTTSIVPEIFTTWKADVSKVQSFMKGYTMTVGESGKAIKQTDGSYGIQYKGNGKESSIAYFFETATTSLYEADIIYAKNAVSDTDLKNYANTNFTPIADDEETKSYMYMSKDGKTIVVLQLLSDKNILGYVDMDYLNKNSVPKKDMPKYAMKMVTGKKR